MIFMCVVCDNNRRYLVFESNVFIKVLLHTQPPNKSHKMLNVSLTNDLRETYVV